jgi:lysozyme family protein
VSSLLFPRCWWITARYEGADRKDGGFVSAATAARIHDPGGPTVFGMSQRALARIDDDGDGHLDFDFDHDGDVDEADLKILLAKKQGGDPKADELIESFYRNRYWSPVRAAEMPWPWCLLAFDAAVNHGPTAAALLLQRATGAAADGRVGMNTLAHIRTAGGAGVRAYVAQRGTLYARIFARDTAKPILGWMARLADLHEKALEA